MKRSTRKPVRNPDETRRALLDAAEAEFNAVGFFGTDTNRIARKAGYAPQTFYRHFDDKISVFLAVYDRWWRSESGTIGTIASGTPRRRAVEDIADAVISFHTRWRQFRRALRHLAVENDAVRAARAAARLVQIEALKRLYSGRGRNEGEWIARLLSLERLCDAVAENEFADLGMTAMAARKTVIDAVTRLLQDDRTSRSVP